jgi:hypothetical protein
VRLPYMKTPETEMSELEPRRAEERDVQKGSIIYLQGDTRPYIVLHPTYVKLAPKDPPSPRGGWMP